jgi:hypothetical protein
VSRIRCAQIQTYTPQRRQRQLGLELVDPVREYQRATALIREQPDTCAYHYDQSRAAALVILTMSDALDGHVDPNDAVRLLLLWDDVPRAVEIGGQS